MLWNKVIKLIGQSETTNAYGEIVTTETTKDVMADVQSVKRSEFYQAATVGVKPELVFVIRSIEYGGEEIVQYEGIRYRVIRTYSKDGELLELTAQKGVR